MSFTRLRKITHKTLSACMAVWLSGVVLLFCCDEINGRSMKADCPLAKMSAHCDKGEKDKASQVIASQTAEQGMECCAFIPVLFDKTRTVESGQQPSAAAPALVVEVPRLVSIQANFAPASSYRSTALLRNNTFLKNRTFRI